MPIITNTTKATKTPAPFSHPHGPCYDPETIILTWDGPNDPENPVNWPTFIRSSSSVTYRNMIGKFVR
ncbi:hypothetical protein BDV29DRAFT_179926 [Aspergillus leporis]|uniref:Uncharacterized protein n=1 Tax=Aspergillus leporis TaxID=41062 RepID=A0A5N5WRP8_9EURO|nr:hypothetical protein BDV29DRAFT_179926 [Aspergillus leporis]